MTKLSKGDKLLITEDAFHNFLRRNWDGITTEAQCEGRIVFEGWMTGGILIVEVVRENGIVVYGINGGGTTVDIHLAGQMRAAYLER